MIPQEHVFSTDEDQETDFERDDRVVKASASAGVNALIVDGTCPV